MSYDHVTLSITVTATYSYRGMLPYSQITTYTVTNYLRLLSVCLVAGNLSDNTGHETNMIGYICSV